LRYGAKLGEDVAARAYVKGFDHDASRRFAGGDAADAWQMLQGGFRLDWTPGESDAVTFQGDAYTGREDGVFRGDFTLGTLPGPSFEDRVRVSGGNVLARLSQPSLEIIDFFEP